MGLGAGSATENVPVPRTRGSSHKGVLDMLRVRCPECGAEADVVPRDGHEVVAVYCLRHRGGADGHMRPVYMVAETLDEAPVTVGPQPIAA